MINLLEKLCAIPSPSGSEASIRDFIIGEISPYADYFTDNLGNLIVSKKGAASPDKKLMLAAHMDEVGFIITAIRDDGLLEFSAVGGISPEVIAGRRVKIGSTTGVISLKPIHLLDPEERKKPIKKDDLYIDIGADSADEATLIVSPGDTAVFDSDFVRFGDNLIKARAIDDKIGCAILIELIRSPLPYDITAVFTVQEEVGCRGAKAAAYTVAPDVAVVLEATTAADISGVSESDKVCSIGNGPAISFMDGRTVYDKELYSRLFAIAEENSIKCQPKAAVAGGNDAGSIHLSRGGVRTCAISLPCRYLHSACCVISESDAYETCKLVSAAIKDFLK